MVLIEQDANTVVSDINSKLRILESKNNILAEHLLTVNENSLEEYKRIRREIEIINGDVKKLKEDLFNLRQAIKGFLGEIDYFAKKTDIKILEKYINLWNPLEFVREEDVEKIIEEKLSKLKKGGKTGRGK